MGTLISARVSNYIANIIKVSNIFLWADSEIVLHWIKKKKKWKSFVSNWISEIHELSDSSLWKHCDDKFNPANLITRGCSIKQLISSQKWRYDPECLFLTEDQWPSVKTVAAQLPNVSEEKSLKTETILCVVQTNNAYKTPFLNLSKYS